MKDTIVYYGGFALPDKNAAANRVVSNGKIFKALGYNVVFLGADYDESFNGIKTLENGMLCEAHPSGSVQWLKQIVFFKNLKQLVKTQGDVRLVILYNVSFVTLSLAKLFFKKHGIEVCYDCTEWTKFTDGSVLKKAFKYIDEFFVRHFAHRVADRMIVISHTMEKAYKSKRPLLLPPLVDVENPIWNQAVSREKEKFVFCFAGFPDGNKDYINSIVEAFDLINADNISLNIVGITENEFNQMYPDCEISDKTKFMGRLTHNEAIKQILSCDCYIFLRPSDRRNNAGFPTKFAESYTCGVKIITTDVSDVKDYADEDCFIIDSADIEAVGKLMKNVVNGTITDNGIRPLRESFDYRKYITKAQQWLK